MRTIFLTLFITSSVIGCYIPEKRVTFELKPSDTRDQATTQKEIAPGLKAVFMHGFQTRTYIMFEFIGRKRLKKMECVATLRRADGTTYKEEFEVEHMIMKLAFVNDERHIRWMQDDLISLDLGGQVYKLYDEESTKRVLRQLYEASENKKF